MRKDFDISKYKKSQQGIEDDVNEGLDKAEDDIDETEVDFLKEDEEEDDTK